MQVSAEPISSSISGMKVEVEISDDTKTSSDDVDARYSYYQCNIANYLLSGIYPAGANKATKSGLYKRSKFFTVEGGHLHYIGGKIKKKHRLVLQSVDKQRLHSRYSSSWER